MTWPKNNAFKGAFLRGVRDGLANATAKCPYPDHRTSRGHNTFSRAFQNYWWEGYELGEKERLAKANESK